MAETPTSDWTWINAVADRFERAWKQGARPRIEDYLAEVDAPRRAALLDELLRVERELRRRAGDDPVVAEYAARFPGHGALIEALFGPGPSRPAPSVSKYEPPPIAPDQTGGQTGASGEPSPGDRVRYFGDYEIDREIARGGMGVVFRARQISLNRTVALKMILAGQLADENDIKRFYTEAEAAAQLDHPGIVPIFEVGRHEEQHFFSMAFVEGRSLAERLADGPMPPRDSAALLLHVTTAVEYAHSRGVIHRDLKPSNILIGADGNPRVTDFGLAKRVQGDSGLTGSGQIMGTPSYMPPEQAGGRRGEVGTPADVYALGATLYCMVTGRPPFQAATAMDTVLQVLSDEPVPPRRLSATIPRDLETMCLKCLEKEPGKRYASAAALREDLRSFLVGEPIAARPVGRPERAWRWCRRNPWLAGAVSLVAAALVVVASLALLYADRQTRLATSEGLRADEQTRHSNEQAKAAVKLKDALAQSNRRLALLNLQRGQAACDQGQIGPGLLWMVESLRAATVAGDPDWKNAALANLSDWRRYYIGLKGMCSYDGGAATLAFSPDGKTILTGSPEGTARLWDVATGRSIGQPLVHQGGVTAAAYSPDGNTALTGSFDGMARLWDAATSRLRGQPFVHQGDVAVVPYGPGGKLVRTHAVRAVAYSPDGKTVCTGSLDKTARLWDVATGRPVGQPLMHQGYVEAVAYSPDGKTVLTGSSDGTARLWDVVTGLSTGQPLVHQGGVNVVAYGPDGTIVRTHAVRAVAYSPDGKTVLTASVDSTARLWDAATGQPVGEGMKMERGGRVTSVAFSPDSKTIVTGSTHGAVEDAHLGSTGGSVQLWDAATGVPLGSPLEYQSAVRTVAFSPDGETILVGSSDGRVRLWDVATGMYIGRPLEHEHPEVRSVAFSPDGKTVLTGNMDGTAQFWDAAAGLPIGKPLQHQGGIPNVAFSPDGKSVLTGSRDKTARLWNVAIGRPIGQPLVHQDSVEAVAFSPDGKSVLTGSFDSTARRWDAITGLPAGRPLIHKGRVYAVAFSPDGKTILSGCQDKTAQLWDLATGVPIGEPLLHQDVVAAVAYSPDGKTVLTGCQDGTAQLWNSHTGKATGPPLRHPAAVGAVTFSPDGKTILTGCEDRKARLWDTATGEPIGKSLEHSVMVFAVAFSPDGKTILTGSHAAMARLWGTPAPLPDDLPRLIAWVETLTGLELDEQGAIRVLDAAAWRQRRDRLSGLGGPPKADTSWSRDPILFGWDPTARARAWVERKRWAEAEAAFDAAVRARPSDAKVWIERGQFYLMRSEPEKAANALGEAILLNPNDSLLRSRQILSLVAAGDLDRLRLACFDLLDRFRNTEPFRAYNLAQSCALARGSAAFHEDLVKLAEIAEQGLSGKEWKQYVLNTLGVVLYRAGRFKDAIRRLEEGIRFRKGESLPQDWAFLSMAHGRLGHHDEARRWLDRFRSYQPNADPNAFWAELEIRLLRSEADAVVVYDPIFPADPFAH
jgi:eukaryotic-like serine/threonine-protein kinase